MWHLSNDEFVEQLAKKLDLTEADELRVRFEAARYQEDMADRAIRAAEESERAYSAAQYVVSALEQQVEDLTGDRAVLLMDRRKALDFLDDHRDGLTSEQITQLLEILGA